MDLHQGSNEYNPLRTKPMTAAMKQDQKHIESHVYDPSTGKTVVSVVCITCMLATMRGAAVPSACVRLGVGSASGGVTCSHARRWLALAGA